MCGVHEGQLQGAREAASELSKDVSKHGVASTVGNEEELGPKEQLCANHAFQAGGGVTLQDDGRHEVDDLGSEVVNVSDDTLQPAELADEDVALSGLVNSGGSVDKS